MKLIKVLFVSLVFVGYLFTLLATSHFSVLAAHNERVDTSLSEARNTSRQNVNFDAWHLKHPHAVPQRVQTDGNSVFIFDPHRLRWAVYDRNGELVGAGHGSGGRSFCPDIQAPCRTPVGTFHVDAFGGPDCVSTLFPVGEGGAPMPYCMYVDADFAIHGSYEVPNYNASHGCIRVRPSVAKWLQENVIEYGTTVIVKPY